jgi:hypothetical protein
VYQLNKKGEVDILLGLYDIYDRHRESIIWFLHKLDVQNYDQYEQKYHDTSEGLFHFTAICGFFELSGVLVNTRLIDPNIYFDVFNPTPYWQKAKPIVEGMRKERPHIYENFELLNNKRLVWTKTRRNKIKR